MESVAGGHAGPHTRLQERPIGGDEEHGLEQPQGDADKQVEHLEEQGVVVSSAEVMRPHFASAVDADDDWMPKSRSEAP